MTPMVDLSWTMPHTNFIISRFRINVRFGSSLEIFDYYTSQVKQHYNYTLKNFIPGGQYEIWIATLSRYDGHYWHHGPRFRLRKFSLTSCGCGYRNHILLLTENEEQWSWKLCENFNFCVIYTWTFLVTFFPVKNQSFIECFAQFTNRQLSGTASEAKRPLSMWSSHHCDVVTTVWPLSIWRNTNSSPCSAPSSAKILYLL